MSGLTTIGKSVVRVDALEKATGKAIYCADVVLPGMLYVKVLRCPHPHARIARIDAAMARNLPGVVFVATGEHAPAKKLGSIIYDEDVITKDIARAIGAPIAAVAAESLDIAEEAVALIDVEYEKLPALFDPEESVRANPPVVIHPDLAKYEVGVPHYYRLDPERPNVFMHYKVRHGDVDKAFKSADIVLENKFTTGRVQHCALERHVTVARPESDGGVTVWLSNQCAQARRADLCRLFDIKPSKVRVVQPYLGGGFGGKAIMREEAIAVLLALRSGRPVKLELSREEVFFRGGTRPRLIITIKDGARKDGTLVAREMTVILAAGGSAESNIASVVRNCSFAAVGTYKVANFKWDSYGVYLNDPIANPFRGFGNTQVAFAIESQMNMLAEKLGLSPVEIREKNLLREGDINATGEITHSIGAAACLRRVLKEIDYGRPAQSSGKWVHGKGFGLANKYSLAPSASSATVKLTEDGDIILYHGSSELGQGCDTVMAQIAAEEFETSVDRVKIAYSDSLYMPYDFGTISSRVTYHMGNAVKLACEDAKRQICERGSAIMEVPAAELEVRRGRIYRKGGSKEGVPLSQLFAGYGPNRYGSYLAGGDIIGKATFIQDFTPEDVQTGQIDHKPAAGGLRLNAFYAHTARAVEVAVNVETGVIRVLKVAGADDMGQPINPKMVEQQQDGGIGTAIGLAIMEEVKLEQGNVLNPNWTDYRFPTAAEMPKVADFKTYIEAAPHKDGPYGAKGFSEGAMMGIDSAVANAVYEAIGVRLLDLPLNAERVLEAIKRKKG